jgi:hypothetical protein
MERGLNNLMKALKRNAYLQTIWKHIWVFPKVVLVKVPVSLARKVRNLNK